MSTTAEQFRKADDIFRAAAALDPAVRERFIIESSGGDARLLAQLRSLFRADQLPQGVLDEPALGSGLKVKPASSSVPSATRS